MEDQYLTPKQTSEYTGIPESTLNWQRSIRKGIPFHKPTPRIVRYLKSEVDAWMKGYAELVNGSENKAQ